MMKRLFGKQFFQHKWVVPVAALILTLCVGSFALASTAGSDGRSSFIPPSAASTTTSAGRVAAQSNSTTTPSPTFAGGTGGTVSTDAPPAAATTTTDDLQLQQAKENAILDLIAAKMTADDRATFSQLRSTAAQQQVALSKAQADLEATKGQISALIDKYLGLPNDTGTAVTDQATSSTETTVTTVTSQGPSTVTSAPLSVHPQELGTN